MLYHLSYQPLGASWWEVNTLSYKGCWMAHYWSMKDSIHNKVACMNALYTKVQGHMDKCI